MKFREHCAGMRLDESMETVVEFDGSMDGLLAIIRKMAESWPTFPPVDEHTVHISAQEHDSRIGWNTHIVLLDLMGVIGFTSGPVP